jgi:uncharacterized protein (UPF0264 family)
MTISSIGAANQIIELLVSVRSRDEAVLAARAGVDVIDFKEPSDGPLAPVQPQVWQAAERELPGAKLSAALGESSTAIELAAFVPASFRYAKVGPSGVPEISQLQHLWQSIHLPKSVELVPVAYADHEQAGCCAATEVLRAVIASGRSRLLIDTYLKDGRSLTDHLGVLQLTEILTEARVAGVWVALAGSVRLEQAECLHGLGIVPDCWGVRGDVCRYDDDAARRRSGHLDADRVRRWIERVSRNRVTSFSSQAHSGDPFSS